MENKFCCIPYKVADANNLSISGIDKNIPKTQYFETLQEAKKYQKEVLKLGYKSYLEEVEK